MTYVTRKHSSKHVRLWLCLSLTPAFDGRLLAIYYLNKVSSGTATIAVRRQLCAEQHKQNLMRHWNPKVARFSNGMCVYVCVLRCIRWTIQFWVRMSCGWTKMYPRCILPARVVVHSTAERFVCFGAFWRGGCLIDVLRSYTAENLEKNPNFWLVHFFYAS